MSEFVALSKISITAPRLRECVYHISEGKENKEIAAAMGLSIKTIDAYVSKLADLTGCRGRRLVIWALFWQMRQKLNEKVA